eukprot:CAMPEP_0172364474 /NCGR_PEP_ID=MMETSP1060-20121228/7588_1 /TAXON_ID=37318 /ORGANISM="Pseudo-nitzschia pungens, Strain cf. cingulata" /LENGTH=62 /DNA_ID=CAMNT_0013087483 /DNA_START=107 /DNA_END=295 /DNA_ORIENTATION=+
MPQCQKRHRRLAKKRPDVSEKAGRENSGISMEWSVIQGIEHDAVASARSAFAMVTCVRHWKV